MRSRYTAYVLGDEAYLRHTWQASTCPDDILGRQPSPQWIGLKILRTEAGQRQHDTGLVEFLARYRMNGRAHRLHETSQFVRDEGRWVYVAGRVEPAG